MSWRAKALSGIGPPGHGYFFGGRGVTLLNCSQIINSGWRGRLSFSTGLTRCCVFWRQAGCLSSCGGLRLGLVVADARRDWRVRVLWFSH